MSEVLDIEASKLGINMNVIQREYAMKSFLVFVLVLYVPGMFFYMVVGDQFGWYYTLDQSPYKFFFLSLAIFLFPFLISWYFFAGVGRRLKPLPLSLDIYWFFIFVVASLYLACSIYFSLNYDASFRHSSRLSESGSLVAVLFFLKPFVKILGLCCLLVLISTGKLNSRAKCLLFIILMASLTSITASLDLVFVGVLLCLLFFPHIFRVQVASMGVGKIFFIGSGLVVVALSVLYVGVGNKIGFNFIFNEEGRELFRGYSESILPRMSSSLFSAATLADCCMVSNTLGEEAFRGALFTAKNRIDVLLGVSQGSSEIVTISRMNYLMVFNHHAERAGASPGIIGSMFYQPGYPFLFFVLPMFMVFIMWSIARNIRGSFISFNIFSLAAAPYLILGLFESPLNMLYLVDPMLGLFLFFIIMMYAVPITKVFGVRKYV